MLLLHSVLTFPAAADPPADKSNDRSHQKQDQTQNGAIHLPEASARIMHAAAVACPPSSDADRGAGAMILHMKLICQYSKGYKGAQN